MLRVKIEQAVQNGASLGSFKNAELLSAIGDKGSRDMQWAHRRVAGIRKSRKVGANRRKAAIKRSGGSDPANTRAEYYQIRNPNQRDDLLMLPPPFRPPFSGQSSWTVAFGRSRPATADMPSKSKRWTRRAKANGLAFAVENSFRSPYC